MNDKTDPADELRQALQEALGEFRGYAQTLAQDDALRKAITPAGELDITQEIRQMALHEAQAAHRAEDQTREAFAYLIVLASLTSSGTTGATLDLSQATKQKLGLLKTAAVAQLKVNRLRLGALVLEQVLPRLRQLVKVKGQKDLADNLTAALNTCGDALRIQQRLPEATEVLDEAARIIIDLLDNGERGRSAAASLAGALNNLGAALGNQNSPEAVAILEEAVRIYRRLVEDEGGVKWDKDLARTLNNLGIALRGQNKPSEATDALKEAVSIYRHLVEEEGQVQWANKLAWALNCLGAALRDRNELPEAVDALKEAVRICRRLVNDESGVKWVRYLAQSLINLGAALRDRNELPEAVDALKEAVSICRRLVNDESGVKWVRYLAQSLNNLGNALGDQYELLEAVDTLKEAVSIYRRLVEGQGQVQWASELSAALNNLGITLRDQRELPGAVNALKEAVSIYRRLVKDEGGVQWDRALAPALNNLGSALSDQNKLSEAIDALEEVVSIFRRLVEDEGRVQWANDLAHALANFGNTLRHQNKLSKAIHALKEAVGIYRRLVEDEGQVQRASELAGALSIIGNTLHDQNKPSEAIDALMEAVRIYGRVVKDEGGVRRVRDLARGLNNLGNALRNQNTPSAAIATLKEAVRLYRRLVEGQGQGQVQWANELALALYSLGAALRDQDELLEAVDAFQEAVSIFRRLIEGGGRAQWVNDLVRALTVLGIALGEQNKLPEALIQFKQAVQAFKLTTDLAWDTPGLVLWVSNCVMNCHDQFPEGSRPAPDIGMFFDLAQAFESAMEFRSLEELRGEMGADDPRSASTLELLEEFTGAWLRAFVAAGQWQDAAAVVTRAHARRLETLQFARLYAQGGSDDLIPGQRQFFERLAQLYALDMQLARRLASRSRPPSDADEAPGGEPGPSPSRAARPQGAFEFQRPGTGGLDALELEREAILRELRTLRSELIREGLMPDPQQWRRSLDEHVSQLQAHQAMAVIVAPSEFGVDDQEVSSALVLLGLNFSTMLPAANLPTLTAATHALAGKLSGRGRVRKGAQAPEGDATDAATGSVADVTRPDASVEADLHEQMRQTIWAPLQTELTQHGITELLMFTHGEGHVLPWIAGAPAELNLRLYPSLHMRTPSRSAAVTLPDEATPLYVLANDASTDSDPTRRLWYVKLEVRALRLLHDPEDKGIVQDKSHPRHLRHRGMVWAIGHGDHAHEGQEGNAMLSCGSPPDEPDVEPFAFIDHGQAMPAVMASACLVGRVKDVEHEPMGLPTVLSLGEVGLIAGSLVAVDDLFASVFALSVNSHWRHAAQARSHGGDLRQAMLDAQRELLSGNWSEHVLQDFRHVCRQALPMVLSAICQTTLDQHSSLGGASGVQHRQLSRAITAQIEMLRDDWGLCKEGSISGVTHLAAQLAAEPQAVADEAIGYFLAHRNSDNLRSRAQTLARFWTIIG